MIAEAAPQLVLQCSARRGDQRMEGSKSRLEGICRFLLHPNICR
jgi:hypothetical protein